MKTKIFFILTIVISLQLFPSTVFASLSNSKEIYFASNSDDEYDDEEGSEEEQENEEIEENA